MLGGFAPPSYAQLSCLPLDGVDKTPDAGITTGATTTAGVSGCTVGTTADAATGAGEVAGAFALTDAATMLLAFTRPWATDAAAWASGVVGAGLLTAGGTGLPAHSPRSRAPS